MMQDSPSDTMQQDMSFSTAIESAPAEPNSKAQYVFKIEQLKIIPQLKVPAASFLCLIWQYRFPRGERTKQ